MGIEQSEYISTTEVSGDINEVKVLNPEDLKESNYILEDALSSLSSTTDELQKKIKKASDFMFTGFDEQLGDKRLEEAANYINHTLTENANSENFINVSSIVNDAFDQAIKLNPPVPFLMRLGNKQRTEEGKEDLNWTG